MIGALNLPLHGQPVCTKTFPRVYCGKKPFLSEKYCWGWLQKVYIWPQGWLIEGSMKVLDNKGYKEFNRSSWSHVL